MRNRAAFLFGAALAILVVGAFLRECVPLAPKAFRQDAGGLLQ